MFLVDGKFTFESTELMLDKSSIAEEMISSTIQSIFVKSILTEKVVQLPEDLRFLTFVEFISFVVRLIHEAYSSPACEKYHETDIRKLMFGLNELAGA